MILEYPVVLYKLEPFCGIYPLITTISEWFYYHLTGKLLPWAGAGLGRWLVVLGFCGGWEGLSLVSCKFIFIYKLKNYTVGK